MEGAAAMKEKQRTAPDHLSPPPALTSALGEDIVERFRVRQEHADGSHYVRGRSQAHTAVGEVDTLSGVRDW
jgi:hypothetical protein